MSQYYYKVLLFDLYRTERIFINIGHENYLLQGHRIVCLYRTTEHGRKDQSHSDRHISNRNRSTVIDISSVRRYLFHLKKIKKRKKRTGFFVQELCCLAD